MRDCFKKHATNQLSPNQEYQHEQASAGPTFTTSNLRFQEASPLVTFEWQSASASQWQSQPHFLHESALGGNCFVDESMRYLRALSANYPDFYHMCSSSFSLIALGNSALHDPPDNNRFHVSAVWMGRNLGVTLLSLQTRSSNVSYVSVPFTKWESKKRALDWLVPAPDTVLRSLLNVVEAQMCNPIGEHAVTDTNTDGKCFLFDANLLTTAVTPHLSGRPAPLELSRRGKACSINFVIPGFMKCATSFLFEGTVMLTLSPTHTLVNPRHRRFCVCVQLM
jgi:hypothetical protein